MLVIHKLDGTDWIVKGIKISTPHPKLGVGWQTIRLLLIPDFETDVLEQAITRVFNDKEMASKEFARLKEIMDTPGKAVFGIGKDFSLNYVKSVNGTMGSLDGLPFISPKDEEEKTTTLPATCRYCQHDEGCDCRHGKECDNQEYGNDGDCPYFDYKDELPECVVCEERFEKPQVGYKLVCPACIKKGYFQEHTDEYIAQQRKLLKEQLQDTVNMKPVMMNPDIPLVVKSQLTEDFLLYGAAYLVTEKEGDSTIFKVISPKDLTIVSSTDNALIDKDKISEVIKRFGGRLWSLSCPHCGESGNLVAVHLADSIITDHNVTLACYCHSCEKKFKASYISPIGPMIAPRTKCQDMKVADCVGCTYFIKDECQHPRNTGTSVIE